MKIIHQCYVCKILTTVSNNNYYYIIIYCNWVVTRWPWLFYMHINYEIGYY